MSMHEAQTLPLTLGQQFAAARNRAGLDQDGLGSILGVNRTTISRWERDIAEPPFSAVATLSYMSDWPLELFSRAAAPRKPTPDDPGGVLIDASGCFSRTADGRRPSRSALAAVA